MLAENREPTQDEEKAIIIDDSSHDLYTVFPRSTKIFILVMATLGGFFSPFSTSVYFPALTPLAEHFNVSTNLINLTITTYMIFQGVAPMMYADFADQAGRRPAFFATFVVYMFANIGLAVQDSYAALLVLRCLQSAGSSGTIALTRGVLADIASPAERFVRPGFLFVDYMLTKAQQRLIRRLVKLRDGTRTSNCSYIWRVTRQQFGLAFHLLAPGHHVGNVHGRLYHVRARDE